VIYLEGPTDAEAFFALLGVLQPKDGVYEGTKVKAVGGAREVCKLVETAHRLAQRPRRGDRRYAGIFGVVDGDGLPLAELCRHFDGPDAGPVFRWKAYSIENLLALAGWPPAWGAEPEWPGILREYTAYVALNRTRLRLQEEMQASLNKMGLADFTRPTAAGPLRTVADVSQILTIHGRELARHDVLHIFQEETTTFETAIQADLRQAHALLDGKWLIDHLAVSRTRRSKEECRKDWVEHARSHNGLPEIQHFYERLVRPRPAPE
jgi:hypothetical protein